MDVLVKEQYADLVRHHPAVRRVMTFPSHGTFRDLRAMRREIIAERYDRILDLHGSLRSRWLCAGLGNVTRIRKRIVPRWILIHTGLDLYRWWGGAPAISTRYCETAADLGIADDGVGPEIFFPPGTAARAHALLAGAGIDGTGTIVGLCPMARHRTKTWPAERFADVAAAMSAGWHAQVVIFGSAGEQEACEAIALRARTLAPGIRIAVMAGQSSLLETASMMDACALVVTNDTGLMHLAAARKRPLVAIFGSTTRQFGFFPAGTQSRVVEQQQLSCRPCTHIGRQSCPKGHFRCMLDTSVADVLQAARALRREGAPS